MSVVAGAKVAGRSAGAAGQSVTQKALLGLTVAVATGGQAAVTLFARHRSSPLFSGWPDAAHPTHTYLKLAPLRSQAPVKPATRNRRPQFPGHRPLLVCIGGAP